MDSSSETPFSCSVVDLPVGQLYNTPRPAMPKKVLFLLSVVLLSTTFRTRLLEIRWSPVGWRMVPPQPSRPILPTLEADLDSDGSIEQINLRDGRLSIDSRGRTLWTNPEDWRVKAAQIADLNRDGRPEMAMLVWRPFAPWPIDSWIPYGGRIAEFHDAENQSCHIILWGWAGDRYRELWAGSPLAEPLVSFYAADWNGDGLQELAAAETAYGRYPAVTAFSLWRWNGFGFSLIDRLTAGIGEFRFIIDGDSRPVILFEPTGWFG
jgi:hypothetical protein